MIKTLEKQHRIKTFGETTGTVKLKVPFYGCSHNCTQDEYLGRIWYEKTGIYYKIDEYGILYLHAYKISRYYKEYGEEWQTENVDGLSFKRMKDDAWSVNDILDDDYHYDNVLIEITEQEYNEQVDGFIKLLRGE